MIKKSPKEPKEPLRTNVEEYTEEYFSESVDENGESEYEYYSEYHETDAAVSIDKASRESARMNTNSLRVRENGNKSPHS